MENISTPDGDPIVQVSRPGRTGQVAAWTLLGASLSLAAAGSAEQIQSKMHEVGIVGIYMSGEADAGRIPVLDSSDVPVALSDIENVKVENHKQAIADNHAARNMDWRVALSLGIADALGIAGVAISRKREDDIPTLPGPADALPLDET